MERRREGGGEGFLLPARKGGANRGSDSGRPLPQPARFLVFGAGAVGSVFAARLAARFPVTVVARGRRLSDIRRAGIRVEGATEAHTRPRAASPAELAGFRPDFALVTVKAHQTPAAARSLAALGTAPVRVSLQNGLGNEETLAAGGYPTLGAVSNSGATLLPSGAVFHAGLGEVILSPFANTEEAAARNLAGCLAEAGFPVRPVPDIRKPLWDKAILNAAVNPITALLGLRTGHLLDDPGTVRLLRLLVGEAVAVARAEAVPASEAEVWQSIRRIVARTAENKSSMLQDLERGVRTEIDAITGAIVARGDRRGLPTPWNRLMLRLVRAREQGAAKRAAGR